MILMDEKHTFKTFEKCMFLFVLHVYFELIFKFLVHKFSEKCQKNRVFLNFFGGGIFAKIYAVTAADLGFQG